MDPSINAHYTPGSARLPWDGRRTSAPGTGETTRPAGRDREFKAGLEQHIVWGEEILFPSFESKFGLPGGPTEVMRWEHREIRKFLDAIAEKLARDDGDTEAEETGLQAVLCQHNHKEENILYPMIDQVIGEEERAEIFARMGANG